MSLIENLKNGNINTILLIVGFLFIFHIYWTKDNKEHMGEVSGDIKDVVKQVYLADVEAIRNLSEVSTKLQAGGLTVPSNLNIRGKMNIGSDANSKDFPDWLGLSVENAGDSHIRLKTKNDENKNVYLIDRDGNFRINTHGIGDMFGVNRDGHTYNIHTGDHVHHFVGKGDNPYITLSKDGEFNNKSWYLQNVKNDGSNKIFRIGVHAEGPKLDIHRNGNAYVSGQLFAAGRNILGELDKNIFISRRFVIPRNCSWNNTGVGEDYTLISFSKMTGHIWEPDNIDFRRFGGQWQIIASNAKHGCGFSGSVHILATFAVAKHVNANY